MLALCFSATISSYSQTSGTLGDNLSWTLDANGVLTISGTDAMPNYAWANSPWHFNTSIKEVIISDGVTSIGSLAFPYCSSLQSITIPESVSSIGYDAFSNCASLQSITIPESVTSIGNRAFSGCASLQSITIPEKVTSIGDYAFSDCTGLTSLAYNAIDCVSSFSGCSALATVTIGEKVTKIPSSFLSGCTGLKAITIPESVTSIGYGAFSGCTGLTSLTYNAIDCAYSFSGCSALATVTIGGNVTKIPSSFLSGCANLQSISIPEKVASINNNAFYGCTGLKSITIPESVTSIGNGAFYNCSSLQSITLPEKITSIQSQTFSGCTALKSITIPLSVSEIGESAFSTSGLTSITIPKGVRSIGWSAFGACNNLAKVVFAPESEIAEIGDWAFSGSGISEELLLPTSLKSISSGAFSDCKKLPSIVIPKKVETIGDYAFRDCSALTKVVAKVLTPPLCRSTTFDGVNTIKCNLHIPTGSKELYEKTVGWRDFLTIIEDIADLREEQTIHFPPLEAVTYGDADIVLPATTDMGVAIVYSSSNQQAATVLGNILTIAGAGEALISASAPANEDYFAAEPKQQKLTVSKAALTVSVDNATRKQGEENPAFTLTYSGFKNDEDESVLTEAAVAATNAKISSNAGFYDIIISGGAAANYTFNYQTGKLEITQRIGLEDVSVGMSIFPNPVKDYLYIQSDSRIEKIELYNQVGICVLIEPDFVEKLSVSHLPDGLYFIRIYTTDGKIISRKVMIER